MAYKLFSYLLASISLFIISNNAFAFNPSKPAHTMQTTNLVQQNKALLFEENKGQLMDENRKAITNVKYYGHSCGVYLYCKPGMLSFVFTKAEKENNNEAISEATGKLSPAGGDRGRENRENPQPSKISTSRMDLLLIGSNLSATVTTTDLQEYYENFYTTGDADHGITNVHTYKTITYESIYPNIDMVLNCKEQGMEYSFLVHPGGKVSDIQLRWNGTDKAEAMENGGIRYGNSLGSIEESTPKGFADGKEIKSSFIKKQATYSFNVENYDKGKDLLIDPWLSWGTYYGGTGDDYGYGVSTDALGNVYITGQTSSGNGIATSGAYQTSYDSISGAAFLVKFSSSGIRSWATYYDGAGVSGVSTDVSGNVYIVGGTGSSGMATYGAHQTLLAGYDDAFLAKFSSSGSRTWATYYGGGGQDWASAVSTDSKGNVYITGATKSKSGIATSGAYQTSQADNYDAFLAKFNSSGGLSWGTYFGGSYDDYSQAVNADASGNIFITGYTQSSDGIATTGAYQTSYAGGASQFGGDAFLAKFSSSGKRLWATYYGGSGDDLAFGVSTDASGNVYIAGSTGSSGIATTGAFQTSLLGGGDAFLAKFSSSGSISWATYYGGSGGAGGDGVSTDASGNVYITGETSSGNGIATSDAYQTSLIGKQDAFLAQFNSSGGLSWATYYGGGLEGASGVSTDVFGNVYITGSTESSSGIATSGAYQTSYAGGAYDNDAFLAKFRFKTYQNDAGIDYINNPSGTLCASSQPVIVHLQNYGSKPLTSVKIGWTVNGTSQTTYSWTGTVAPGTSSNVTISNGYKFTSGTIKILAYTSLPNNNKDSVPDNDTARMNFTVNSIPLAIVGNAVSICIGSSTIIGSSIINGHSYTWTSKPSGFSSTSANPTVSPSLTTTYILSEVIIATGCSNIDSVKVTVNLLPNAGWTVNNISQNYYFHVKDSSFAQSSYVWDFGDGTSTSKGYSVSHVFPQNKTYTVKLSVTNSNSCVGEHDSSVNVTASGIIPNQIEDFNLSIYPNPFQTSTSIAYNLSKTTNVQIALFDVTGKQILLIANGNQLPGKHQYEIDGVENHLVSDLYLLKIEIGDQYIPIKLMKF